MKTFSRPRHSVPVNSICMSTKQPFPDDFLWGSATSAYQVEGSPLADGAGACIWHRFSHTRGMTREGDTGDIACDHYRRVAEDVALMRDLGLKAYRFSISWSRVFPDGTGRVNERGLDFYERLVDLLLASGIEPMATLYHWDLPAALDDRGGWQNRDVVGWFADYAQTAFRRLDGRVKLWATINEPWVVMNDGYVVGTQAPGHRSPFEAMRVSHHLLLAHAAAVRAYRAEGRHKIGLVVNLEPKYPASDHADDIAACQRADAYMNRQFLDPIYLGSYPRELVELYGEDWPDWAQDDLAAMREPADFLGVNYYSRSVVEAARDAGPLAARGVRQRHASHTEMGWEVFPQGLADILQWIKDRYGNPPVYITENGAAFYDPPVAEAPIEDSLRIDYYRRHLIAVRTAMATGCDVRGYFAWSLFDNFEWAHGYSKRFGLVHVDFETLRRTPKASAKFFADVIASRGKNLYRKSP
jgi:beta-glucosidase